MTDQPVARVRADVLEIAHLLSVLVSVLCALAIAHWTREGTADPSLMVWAPLAIVALGFARAMRVGLQDFLAQFSYKEKFALMLVHALAFVLPALMGFRGWDHAVSALLVFMCIIAVEPRTFSRIVFVGGTAVFLRVAPPPSPPFILVATWMLGTLLAMRFEHVRFRVVESEDVVAPRVSVFLLETVRGAVLPWAFAVALYFPLAWALHGESRWIEYSGPQVQAGRPMGPVSSAEALLWALFLAAVIIGVLVTLAWLERKLRTQRGSGGVPEEGMMGAAEARESIHDDEESTTLEALDEDARARVLRRFERFAKTLAKLGAGRGDGETARQYTDRLAGEAGIGARLYNQVRETFDPACYSQLPIAEEDAAEFTRTVDGAESELRESLASKPAPPR